MADKRKEHGKQSLKERHKERHGESCMCRRCRARYQSMSRKREKIRVEEDSACD